MLLTAEQPEPRVRATPTPSRRKRGRRGNVPSFIRSTALYRSLTFPYFFELLIFLHIFADTTSMKRAHTHARTHSRATVYTRWRNSSDFLCWSSAVVRIHRIRRLRGNAISTYLISFALAVSTLLRRCETHRLTRYTNSAHRDPEAAQRAENGIFSLAFQRVLSSMKNNHRPILVLTCEVKSPDTLSRY